MSAHRHRWEGEESVAAVGAPGFSGPFLDRIEKKTGVRLTHPGYGIARCNCGLYRITDYCGPSFGRGIITAEQREGL